MVDINKSIISKLQTDYSNPYLEGNNRYVFDGNLFTQETWTDKNNDGKKDDNEWALKYFTDKHSLHGREALAGVS